MFTAKIEFAKTQCLIIDKVSMVSAKTLGQVEFILRKTRKCEKRFGECKWYYVVIFSSCHLWRMSCMEM